MSPSKESNQNNSPTTELLMEGARGFLNACNAVAEFRRLVQSICREVLKERLTDINSVLGVQFTMDDAEASGKPDMWDDPDTKGQWATCGCKFKLPHQIGFLDLYLWWDQTLLPDRAAAVVCFRFREKMEGLRAFASALQPVGFQCDDKTWEIYLLRELFPEQMQTLKVLLLDLISELVAKAMKASTLKSLIQKKKLRT